MLSTRRRILLALAATLLAAPAALAQKPAEQSAQKQEDDYVTSRAFQSRVFAENIAVIAEAISRLDRPEPARPAVEFRVHMLVASNDEAAPNRYPAELSHVVKQPQPTLGYKNFTLIGSQIVRSKEGRGDNYNKGVADLKLTNDTPASKNPIFYTYTLRSVSLDD